MKFIVELITLVFVVLKLADVIDWSWWLVLSPLLGCWALALVLYGIVGMILARAIRNGDKIIYKALSK